MTALLVRCQQMGLTTRARSVRVIGRALQRIFWNASRDQRPRMGRLYACRRSIRIRTAWCSLAVHKIFEIRSTHRRNSNDTPIKFTARQRLERSLGTGESRPPNEHIARGVARHRNLDLLHGAILVTLFCDVLLECFSFLGVVQLLLCEHIGTAQHCGSQRLSWWCSSRKRGDGAHRHRRCRSRSSKATGHTDARAHQPRQPLQSGDDSTVGLVVVRPRDAQSSGEEVDAVEI
mmetsp:Transcript_14544/g.32646  ORF Transcript_14544/g.32646 Transcript_14544/m.32646 type:complete len:233 (-) Transcript_14544:401-1099(-)